jgi:hypothetical protein
MIRCFSVYGGSAGACSGKWKKSGGDIRKKKSIKLEI